LQLKINEIKATIWKRTKKAKDGNILSTLLIKAKFNQKRRFHGD
jgi:hypothetical protein